MDVWDACSIIITRYYMKTVDNFCMLQHAIGRQSCLFIVLFHSFHPDLLIFKYLIMPLCLFVSTVVAAKWTNVIFLYYWSIFLDGLSFLQFANDSARTKRGRQLWHLESWAIRLEMSQNILNKYNVL